MKEHYLRAKGTSFVDKNNFEILKKHEDKAKLYLVRDYQNRYDKNAIAIETEVTLHDGTVRRFRLGWVSQADNQELAKKLDLNKELVQVMVGKVVGGTPTKPNYGLWLYCISYTEEELQRLSK